MLGRSVALSLLVLVGSTRAAVAQAPAPPGDNKPLLRLEAGGPTSNVTALAFSPDGTTLYAAGFDKVVRVWHHSQQTGKFELDKRRRYRVPINPGMEGAVNALAVSGDGAWLAVGGLGATRAAAGFFDTGRLWPSLGLSRDNRSEQGAIYVFATEDNTVRRLLGHSGPISSLAFAPPRAKKPTVLVSAAQGWDFQKSEKVGEAIVWDIEHEKPLGKLTDLPPPFAGGQAPEVAAIHTGPEVNQLRVALAWGDSHKTANGSRGYLRIWDVERPERPPLLLEDGYLNSTLALLPDETSLVTGSVAMNKGQLKIWDLAATPPRARDQFSLIAPAQSYFLPYGLAVCATPADQAQRVAVLLRALDADFKDQGKRLHLIEMPSGRFGATLSELPLNWNDAINPVLAATSRGDHVAVAGSADHSIWLYAQKGLLDRLGNPAAHETLRSAGATMRHVAFVERKVEAKTLLGLALNENARAPGSELVNGDLIFDFDKRGFTSALADWKIAKPAQDWRVERVGENQRTVLSILRAQKTVSRIALPANQRVDALALSPPGPGIKTPLLAVASQTVNVGPHLDIYDAATGKHCRRFEGHTAGITSLAFAPDGRLLASTAADQTVCVWSLTDLPEILGSHGALPGISVVSKEGEVVVYEVEENSAARTILTSGDVIVGQVVDPKQIKPVRSARDFYELFWDTKPGTAIDLRIRAGNRTKDVTLTAEQGADVRKPLFTLFVTRPGADGQRDWLGWNPFGHFDASGPAAEGYAGWHFNSGKAEEPTKFALLKEYPDFHKKDILKHLVIEGSLAKALEKQKLPPAPRPQPKIGLPLDIQTAANGDLLVRSRQVELPVPIQDFTPTAGDVVEWQFNDENPKRISAPDGNAWNVVLPELPSEGGRHTVRLTVRLREPSMAETAYSQSWTVRYQPPVPQVEFEKDIFYVTSPTPDYEFQARVTTPGEGPKCKVSVWLNDAKMPLERWVLARAAKAQTIQKKLLLKEGENILKIVAVNEDPLVPFEDEERSTRTIKVFYKQGAPLIAVKEIVPFDDQEPALSYEPNQTVVVSAPRVRIVGTITARGNVAAAWEMGLKEGDKQERHTLALAKPDLKQLVFAQVVDLRPGTQTVRFLAKSADTPEASEAVRLLYRPQLPRVILEAPPPELRAAADNASTELTVAGKLQPPRVPSPVPQALVATWVHNGKALPPIRVDSSATELPPQKIQLAPGSNEVKVLLTHAEDWKGSPATDSFEVRYVRPPRIVAVEPQLIGKLPFVNLHAEVRSVAPLVEGSVQVLIDGQKQKYAQAEIQPKKNEAGAWILEVKDIPLILDEQKRVHKNALQVAIRNAEAESEPSAAVVVQYEEPPPPRPTIALKSPGPSREHLLEDPEVSLSFQVNSKAPLKRVVVTQDGQELFRPSALSLASPGVYEFATPKLALRWGGNTLQVEAVNEGGPETVNLTLNVPPRPVQLVLDGLRTEGSTGKVIAPQDSSDGKRSFANVPEGRVVLEGRVRWGNQDEELLKKPHDVRIYVNGFQQVPARLEPASPEKPRERKFQAHLVLNLKENQIRADLPLALQQQENSRQECTASCQKPVRDRQLHLVLVAPDFKEDKQLDERMAKALQAERVGPNLYKSPVFDVVHVHKFTRYVKYLEVDTRFTAIGRLLKRRAAEGSPNDVVMFYFLGQETVNARGRFFWTSETPRQGLDMALALNKLDAQHFSDFPGAQVLFLDLRPGAGSGDGSAVEKEFRLALVRHLQPSGSNQARLLQELEIGIPRATWLEDLKTILQARFPTEQFLIYFPEGLKVPLSPGVGQ